MKTNKIYLVIGIAAIGLIILISNNFGENSESGSNTASKSPYFALLDYEGNTVNSNDISSPMIINVWATWCPFCKSELPDFVELQKEFPQVRVIAVNRGESREEAISFSRTIGLDDILWILDEDNTFYDSIGGFSMPETLFVNAEGEIVVQKRGPMRLDEMKLHTNKILQITN